MPILYVIATMVLGLAANVFDPEMTSTWMREAFMVLGVGFFGEIAIRGNPGE